MTKQIADTAPQNAALAELPLQQHRLLVCGKGGSGKTTVLAQMAWVMRDRGYKVLALDADASNPGGLTGLMFGSEKPRPLFDFFGGRAFVTCPVDDPQPLTRVGDEWSTTESKIELSEIPTDYYLREDGVTVFQIGKIESYCEGCDGPMSKVARDFLVAGDFVTLIDTEAGLEHFGRGIESNIDIVIVVVDPTFESVEVARRIGRFCDQMQVSKVVAILNKVDSAETEYLMSKDLPKERIRILGPVRFDSGLQKSGLTGARLVECAATKDMARIIEQLEAIV